MFIFYSAFIVAIGIILKIWQKLQKNLNKTTTSISINKQYNPISMISFKLPDLKYDYNALEPYVDEMTMKIHHDIHHQGYINKFKATVEDYPELTKENSLEDLLKDPSKLPETIVQKGINFGGGYWNHSFFWDSMAPASDQKPTGELEKRINEDLGGFDKFKEQFTEAAKTQFGSGWAWLCMNDDGKLVVTSTSNQDNPMTQGLRPLLTLDVWEHAYYLKYQNRRPDYIEAFFKIINWEQVAKNMEEEYKID